jgi:hypothetical protein
LTVKDLLFYTEKVIKSGRPVGHRLGHRMRSFGSAHLGFL